MTSEFDFLVYHEVGHAAVAFYFGLRLGPVRVKQDKGGDATSDKGTDAQNVLIALAGGRAELVLDPSCVGERDGAAEDEVCAQNIIQEYVQSQRADELPDYLDKLCYRVSRRLAHRCEAIVREMWPAIQRLAAVLARKPELTGAEAERILAGIFRSE